MQLNVPTIQIVILANFLALAVVWSYVVRSYPNLSAAKFWKVSMCLAATGAAVSMLRGIVPPLLPIVLGNGLMVLACCCAWAGIRRFYNCPAPLLTTALVTATVMVLLGVFTIVHDDINIRVAIMSAAECIPLTLALKDQRTRPEPGKSPGADLASLMIACIVVTHVVRTISAFIGIGGEISLVTFNWLQAIGFLLLVFAGMMTNFGFVLMAIDRLRAEVAGLALIDDLTGIANRRHFLVRLSEACTRASRMNEPLALLVIDLDGFKAINDNYGHGAGDECLRVFTRTVQGRLRAGDLLARSGGDEFCAILPSTTLSEAALVARNLIKACRKAPVQWNGMSIAITASIGIAEWSQEIAHDSQKLIADADQALYIAKKQGRDRLAVYEDIADRLRKIA
jgi:diguanylate cyclase (GGDEF)-like protein